MKYLISFFILFSSLLFANKLNISQKVIDKHFDFCLSDAKKTNKQQYICKEFWIPYATGKIDYVPYGLQDYGFHPSLYINSAETYNAQKGGYSALMGKTKGVEITNEFGDTKIKTVDIAYQALLKRLSKAKTQKEKRIEYKNYYLAYYKLLGDPVEVISYNIDWIRYITVQKRVIESFVQKGYTPYTISVSLNNKQTKNGVLNASYDAYGLYLKFAKYAFVYREFRNDKGTKLSVEKRELLLYSFFVHKRIKFKYGDGGSLYEFDKYNAYLTLYGLAKRGDPDAIKLITLLANSNKEEVSSYLFSIPEVRDYFNFFSKKLKF